MAFQKQYTNLKSPLSFGGISNVRRYPKNAKSAEQELTTINAYLLHREAKKPRFYNPIYVYRTRDILQCDLVDLGRLSKANQDVKFLFLLCDSFSRKCWCRPMKNKTAKSSYDAFVSITRETGTFNVLYCDRGKEFVSGLMKDHLQKENIEIRHPVNKCGTTERLNRTIQNLIFRYMTHHHTDTYVPVLNDIIQLYNNRYHRIIRCTPNFADNPKNVDVVNAALAVKYDKAATKRKPPKLQQGQKVLIQKYRNVFGKGYDPVFKKMRYVIKEVHDTLPIPMYTLEEENGELIDGRFYGTELQIVTSEDYPIEKIIGRPKLIQGVKHVRVKYVGYPASYNEWVPASDISSI